MASPRNMLFISHAAPEENLLAQWLALRLAAEGYPVWCDLTKLLGGEPFWKEIESAIRERTVKFIFVLSKASNASQGTRDELEVAATVRRQLDDDRFIIPLRSEDFSSSETNIRIHQLNDIDFSQNWMTGFKKLVERLEDEGVQKDSRFGTDAVSVWWRQQFGENEGISVGEDLYLTNRLPITSFPENINVIGLEGEPSKELNPDDAPYPVAASKRVLVSFATSRELLAFIEKNKLHLSEGNRTIGLEVFLRDGLFPVIEPRAARNLVSYLLRQAFGRLAKAKGLKEYALSNRRRFYWFPESLLEGDKITFNSPFAETSWKAVVGYKTINARDGGVRIRNWHFGVEALPRIGVDRSINILPHVAFSEKGEPYESSKKQHASRRSQCKSWYNNDWRDRILATLHFLAEKGHVSLVLAPEAQAKFPMVPELVVSPVTYSRTATAPIEPQDEEFESDDDEEESADE